MLSVGVEHNCVYIARDTCVKHYHLVLLNRQHCSITPRSCYVPVLVDDILTNGTQLSALKSGRTRRVGRAAQICSTSTFFYSQYGLFAHSRRLFISQLCDLVATTVNSLSCLLVHFGVPSTTSLQSALVQLQIYRPERQKVWHVELILASSESFPLAPVHWRVQDASYARFPSFLASPYICRCPGGTNGLF